MATVVTLNSPQALLDYLNSITIPTNPNWGVIDKGGKYTIIVNTGGILDVVTHSSQQALEDFIAILSTDPFTVVPKRAGGMFTFYSQQDPIAGINNFVMDIANSPQDLEDKLNAIVDALGTIDYILEHGMKTVILSTP